MLLEFPKLTFVRFDSDLTLEIDWIDGVHLIVQGNNGSKRLSNDEPPGNSKRGAHRRAVKSQKICGEHNLLRGLYGALVADTFVLLSSLRCRYRRERTGLDEIRRTEETKGDSKKS